MRTLAIVTAIFFAAAQPAGADLRYCNGRWTNRNCGSSSVEAVMAERKTSPESEREALADRKAALVQSLQRTLERAIVSSNVSLDIAAEEQRCADETVSVEECTTLVLSKERILRELAIAAEEQQAAREQEILQVPTQYITVVDNSVYCDEPYCFDVPRRHRPSCEQSPDPWNFNRTWTGKQRAIPQMQPEGRAKLSLGGK